MELMSPIDALFLSAESREHPLHVGALQLFEPPAGAGRGFVRETYQAMLQCREIAPLFRKRPTSLHGALINLGWSTDADVDLGYHARRSALPAPGRVRELLELTSRLHSNLLDRHRPLWETHVIEGLRDGRFAIYSKMHHALVDGVSGLTLMRQPMTTDRILLTDGSRSIGQHGIAPWSANCPARAPRSAARGGPAEPDLRRNR